MFTGDFAEQDVRAWSEMVERLHALHDAVASMPMDRATVEELAADLGRWADRLGPVATDEQHQVNGRAVTLPMRGHAMLPPLRVRSHSEGRVEGTVRFGRWFMGGGMAAHGGAVSLLFDEVLGILASVTSRAITRTGYLRTDYRALTPIDTDLDVVAWVDRVEGRKWFVRGEIRHGDVVCAEGEGLFIRLRPDQGLGRRTTD